MPSALNWNVSLLMHQDLALSTWVTNNKKLVEESKSRVSKATPYGIVQINHDTKFVALCNYRMLLEDCRFEHVM